jgi:choline-sulfatase
VGSLLLGTYPAHIDWRLLVYRGGGKLLDPAAMSPGELDALQGRFVYSTVPTSGGRMLSERLRRSGYRTLATAYAGHNEFFRSDGAYDRGWTAFEDMADQAWVAPTSQHVAAAARRQRARGRSAKRWFQWIHFYDPHEARGTASRYDRMVRAFDDALGELLVELEESGAMDRTVIVLTADHGEALGEHRHKAHATSLYEEQVRIPLLIAAPGLEPRRIADPVSLVDVTATLSVVGGAETEGLDGVNLWPTLLEGEPMPARPIFLQLHRYFSNRPQRTMDLAGVVEGKHKLVVDRLRGTARLFDLERDPGETRSVLPHEPERGADLLRTLETFLGRAEEAHPLP